MKLLDEIYAYNGLLDYHELNQLVHKLNERINHAVHPGTGRIPVMYLQKEKAHLSPLPRNVIRKPYQMTHTTVKVNSSCMITYRSNQYSVPPKYLGKRLVIICMCIITQNWSWYIRSVQKNLIIHTIIMLLSVNRHSKSRQWILKRSQKKTWHR